MTARIDLDERQRADLLDAYRRGLDHRQAAAAVGLNLRTLHRILVREPELRAAAEIARGVADDRVEQSLYQQALAGNTTAQIFWLKNRRPRQWRDRHDLVVAHDPDDGIYRSEFPDGEEVYPSLDRPALPAPTDTGSVQ